MEVGEVQRMAVEIVRRIDERLEVRRDGQLTISQILEELGELARLVNSERVRKERAKKDELEEELADVFIQLFALAEIYNLNIERALIEKIRILKERHGIRL
jgi:NTP pyrophosphatase (non-canonical NTP hydrolase)